MYNTLQRGQQLDAVRLPLSPSAPLNASQSGSVLHVFITFYGFRLSWHLLQNLFPPFIAA